MSTSVLLTMEGTGTLKLRIYEICLEQMDPLYANSITVIAYSSFWYIPHPVSVKAKILLFSIIYS